MKRFFVKAALLAIPFLIYAVGIVLVDPFCRFEVSQAIPQASKAAVAPVFNHPLWQVIAARRRPRENITLGGSKMGLLRPALLAEASGLDFGDLTIGGGSMNEAVNMFWYAAKNARLRRVLFGLGIESWNRNNNRDRVLSAESTAESPLLYITNRDVLQDSASLISATYLGGRLPTSAPGMSKDAFWRHQLEESAVRVFLHFEFDEDTFCRLGEIAAYCRDRGIDLKFIILPSHADVHERLRELGAEPAWRGLATRLSSLAPTYDFDVDDDLTRDTEHFTDPFHFDHEVAARIVRQVWTAPPVAPIPPAPR